MPTLNLKNITIKKRIGILNLILIVNNDNQDEAYFFELTLYEF